jgi:hypothetical protein
MFNDAPVLGDVPVRRLTPGVNGVAEPGNATVGL